MQRSLFKLLFVFAFENMEAQTFYANLVGSIAKYDWSTPQAPIKIILNSFVYSDSMIIEKDKIFFTFDKIPYGIYNLKIIANGNKTGLKDFIVEDVLVNKEKMTLDTIFLLPIKTCDPIPQIWTYEFSLTKKSPKEYYSTGELLGEGEHSLTKKYSKKERSYIYSYEKCGIWKYYYKSGTTFKYILYEKGYPKEVIEFYENGQPKHKGFLKFCNTGEWSYYSDGEFLFRLEFDDSNYKLPNVKIKYEHLKKYFENHKLMEIY